MTETTEPGAPQTRTIYLREPQIRYARRRTDVPLEWTHRIQNSRCVGTLLADYRDSMQEHFLTVALSSKNQVIGLQEVSRGTVDQALVGMSETFRFLILAGAAGFIVAHNHPSLDSRPSPEDVALTERISQTATLVGIRFLDHVILGEPDFSFLDSGRMPRSAG